MGPGLLGRASGEAVAQFALEDLPARVARQLVHEQDPFGCLEGGEQFAGVADEFGLGDRAARNDEGGDRFDPAVVGQPDDRCLGDGRMGVERVLDLAGGDENAPELMTSFTRSTTVK